MSTDPIERLQAGPGLAEGIEERRPHRWVLDRDSVFRRLLGVADVAAAAVAVLVVLGDAPLLAVAVPLTVVVAKLIGLYDRDALLLRKTTLDEAPRVLQSGAIVTLALAIAGSDAGGTRLLACWAVLVVVAMAGRQLARTAGSALTEPERVVVVGDARDAARIGARLAETRGARARVVGHATAADLAALVREHDAHRVIVAAGDHKLEGIRAAKALGVAVSVLPRLTEVVGSSVEFDHLAGLTVLGVRRFGLSRSSLFLKRAFDLAGASAGLLLAAPVLLVAAIAVRVTSPGGVLFRQRRIGRDGEPFALLKLRTMVAGAEALRPSLQERNEAGEGLFKIAADPRVTPVGRRLRRISLDELPQLVNVLRGEMSLVGPRPLVPEESRRITEDHRHREHLKPGMTGPWQIAGSSRIPLQEMATMDYLYGANWSLWEDVKILARTVVHVVAGRGV